MATRTLHRPRSHGFTLIELMISIAMVLILLVGVNQVFTYTTAAVGAGQALSAATRDSRAAQTAFQADLSGAANDGPYLIIHSANVYAWRDRADYASDKNALANDYTVTSPDDTLVAPTTLNFRNHRVDVLSFFSRGNFPSQTGDTQLSYNASSSEARIWYGFLRQPKNTYPIASGVSDANYLPPGLASNANTPTGNQTVGTNPNNFFSTDWVLGRVATLLTPNPTVSSYFSYANGKTLWTTPAVAPGKADYSPLSSDDGTNVTTAAQNYTTDTAGTGWYAYSGRFDVAQTSIDSYYNQLQYMISTFGSPTWYQQMFVGKAGTVAGSGDAFECNPFVNATNSPTATSAQMTPAKSALAVPYFVKGCTQFCVEYAGDFFVQNQTTGAATAMTNTNIGNGDGIDFYIDTNNRRQIRWYGFPRNTTGGTAVTTANPAAPASGPLNVLPFRDIYSAAGSPATLWTKPFERVEPQIATPANYSAIPYTGLGDYLCAWGPDTDAVGVPRPKMIRITFTIDTDSKQLPDGQTFQYVYTLPN